MTEGPFLGVARSAQGRRWALRPADPAWVQAHAAGLAAPELVGRILAGRGAPPELGETAIRPTLKALMPDPSTLRDMDRAVSAILDATAAGARIVIFADYDVDGATSGALLLRWFRAVGADASVHVPDRIQDGYGPTPAAMRRLLSEGADLVVTVDCGANAHGALEEAARIGLDVVVFDHHLMAGPAPPALAVVNPNRIDCNSGQGSLTAAGVVFLALAALNRAVRAGELPGVEAAPELMSWLDLAALGTICDVAPLTGFNRALVRQGLRVLSDGANIGLRALADVAKAQAPFGVYHAGFVFGPRLNAGGRLGDSSLAVRLLSTEDADEAAELAGVLDGLNLERRAVEAAVLDEAQGLIARGAAGPQDAPVLVVGKPGWHPGVIGIVAGRLKDIVRRPTIVIGSAGEDDVDAKGSGRSLAGVDLGSAVSAAAAAGVLDAGGGHAMAAGMSLPFDRIDALRAFLSDRLSADVDRAIASDSLLLDGMIALAAATPELLDWIDSAGPYGAGWPEPLFALSDVRVTWSAVAGGAHVRFTVADAAGTSLRGIAFRAVGTPLGELLTSGRSGPLHMAVRLKRDTWNGRNGVDLEAVDAALAGDR